jgi:bacterioferritin-associated ferredoxin
MIVCLCRGVSDRTIRLAIAGGATSTDAVAARCGAGTDCGSCRHAIQDLVQDLTEDLMPDFAGSARVATAPMARLDDSTGCSSGEGQTEMSGAIAASI